MQLEHSFSVPVPVEVAWQALLDPQRVAPCFPGATLTGVDGDQFTGTVKVRLGPVSLLYKGTGRFTSVDEDARRVVLEAMGKDARGNGTASATVTATLAGEGDSTTVGVITDMTITGRPAQLGRGLIGEVSGKILDAFATCLASQLSGPDPAPAEPSPPSGPSQPSPPADPPGGPATDPPTPAPTPQQPTTPPARPAGSAEEIDLLDLAGRPMLKRAAPLAIAALGVVLVLRWLRRRG